MLNTLKSSNIPVSVEDAGITAKKEYESFINKQEEDLDNEELSKEDEE